MTTELTVLGRRVTLIEHLGRGATGDVWLSEASDGARFVLKFARDKPACARLVEEGERLLGVESPWCVRLLGAGRLGSDLVVDADGERARLPRGTAYLVLEHHQGIALDSVRIPLESNPVPHVLAVARDIGRALSDLHATGVAHGDVKPENVLIEQTECGLRARLMDFGLAGAADEAVARGGTRRYLAPEALQAPGSGDARLRDLFALGVMLAELCVPRVSHAKDALALLDSAPVGADIAGFIRPLLSRAPATRPSADWVFTRALALLGQVESESEKLERRTGLVRRSYLAQRRAEILCAARQLKSELRVPAVAGEWLESALALSRGVEELRGSLGSGEILTLNDLDTVGRARWLVALIGASAASWPELSVSSDGELAERLLFAAKTREINRLTFADLESKTLSTADHQLGQVEIALALGRGSCPQALLDNAERRVHEGGEPAALALALSRALRLRGHLGRSLAVLEGLAEPAARIETAETLRRGSDVAGALAALETIAESSESFERAQAIRARLLLDAGEPSKAREMLDGSSRVVAALEVRALSEIRLGMRRDAGLSVARALLLADGDEERCRIEAVSGNLAHFEGDAEKALQSFQRAAEHAARAGAVLEEATYLTGVSAEATQVGELGVARSAARRALLLFESLSRSGDAARALLSMASAHASVGAVIEAREYALAAAQRAKASGDRRCRAYAHLVLADILPIEASEGLEHTRYAAKLIGDDADDRLRVAARGYQRGEVMPLAALDEQAAAESTALDARLDWWAARSRVATFEKVPEEPRRPLEGLLALLGRPAAAVVRGPAFAAGAELAARVADGDSARRLTLAAGEAARELVLRSGSELVAQVRLLPWVRLADRSQTSPFSAEQLSDVDRLVRALGRRDRLRPLLEQVLDALVLWTGVERGLLLLRAPGGKLRPRAARNLLRADLTGAQLELSHSLAERALSQGEPVVAVDAACDLPEAHESVHALKLRSVLAVPLIARGEAFGVVYLDDRVRRGAFGPRELSWVRLIGTLAAVAIADARDQILLRRAARRARRAEARLAAELGRREVELAVAERELARTRDARDTRFPYDDIVGQSEAMRSLLRLVDRVAASEVPVLLIGDSGSGKELVARAIHSHGPRAQRPFVAENCGAIPETLLETTLFGHVRGAFTGAQRPRAGLFEVAHLGSLFLDEIGEMSLGMQAKLLRVLQDGEIRPVGSEKSRCVDVRVIGATHRDLDAMVAAGKFREDLYYRLNVITVRIPNLRERPADVPLLVKHFISRHAGARRIHVEKSALDKLCAYAWPGNVRQLENEVRRALVLADESITPDHLSPDVAARTEVKSLDELNLRQRLDALETELVRVALRRTDGNQTRAAELLGVSRFGLQKMMKRLEISLPSSAVS